MNSPIPQLLALDFDGVICDGMLEYFQTSVRAYCQLWQTDDPDSLQPLATDFYTLRPLIETGWEMPLLLRALMRSIPIATIQTGWSQVCGDLLQQEQIDPSVLAQTLDRVRDEWITQDLTSWLGLHCFYPGIAERLKQITTDSTLFYIITTKEGRFVRQLLQDQGIAIAKEQIIGKESHRPKAETLRQLIQSHRLQAHQIWFVEDLLKSLQKVRQQPDLSPINLFLADWGYNTLADRNAIANPLPNLHLLTLKQFCQDFPHWL